MLDVSFDDGFVFRLRRQSLAIRHQVRLEPQVHSMTAERNELYYTCTSMILYYVRVHDDRVDNTRLTWVAAYVDFLVLEHAHVELVKHQLTR